MTFSEEEFDSSVEDDLTDTQEKTKNILFMPG
jgi:hypothetical protein